MQLSNVLILCFCSVVTSFITGSGAVTIDQAADDIEEALNIHKHQAKHENEENVKQLEGSTPKGEIIVPVQVYSADQVPNFITASILTDDRQAAKPKLRTLARRKPKAKLNRKAHRKSKPKTRARSFKPAKKADLTSDNARNIEKVYSERDSELENLAAKDKNNETESVADIKEANAAERLDTTWKNSSKSSSDKKYALSDVSKEIIEPRNITAASGNETSTAENITKTESTNEDSTLLTRDTDDDNIASLLESVPHSHNETITDSPIFNIDSSIDKVENAKPDDGQIIKTEKLDNKEVLFERDDDVANDLELMGSRRSFYSADHGNIPTQKYANRDEPTVNSPQVDSDRFYISNNNPVELNSIVSIQRPALPKPIIVPINAHFRPDNQPYPELQGLVQDDLPVNNLSVESNNFFMSNNHPVEFNSLVSSQPPPRSVIVSENSLLKLDNERKLYTELPRLIQDKLPVNNALLNSNHFYMSDYNPVKLISSESFKPSPSPIKVTINPHLRLDKSNIDLEVPRLVFPSDFGHIIKQGKDFQNQAQTHEGLFNYASPNSLFSNSLQSYHPEPGVANQRSPKLSVKHPDQHFLGLDGEYNINNLLTKQQNVPMNQINNHQLDLNLPIANRFNSYEQRFMYPNQQTHLYLRPQQRILSLFQPNQYQPFLNKLIYRNSPRLDHYSMNEFVKYLPLHPTQQSLLQTSQCNSLGCNYDSDGTELHRSIMKTSSSWGPLE